MSGAAAALVIPGLLGAFALPAQADTVPADPTSSTSTTVAPAAPVAAPKPAPAPAKKVVKKRPSRMQVVVSTAEHYFGVRYRFGGATPAGFDCSGLTKYVYAHIGIRLSHSARAQLHAGHAVSHRAARAGDLIVFNGGKHVGIWINSHTMIDAPKPGGRVGFHRIYTSAYSVRRV